MNRMNVKRLAAAALAVALSVALSACFVLPGKFAETLDIRKDHTFTYTYKGEVVVLGLTKLMGLADAMGSAGTEEFIPAPCVSQKTGKDRPCTKAEEAKQKAEWDEGADSRAAAKKQRDEGMVALMGGLDPNDPKSGEELAERLRKQAGWTSVVYKGDGLYEVDFRITGKLTHDFSFPTIERMPSVLAFLTVNVRADGTARVSSPMLDQSSGAGSSLTGFAGLGAMMAAAEEGEKSEGAADDQTTADKDAATMNKLASFPKMDGTFVLTTDGIILANNTEDGPKADPAGKRLEWKINIRNPAAPMALIELGK